MKDFFKKRLTGLSEEELKFCYEDIVNYNKTGIMGENLIRKIRKEFADEIGDPSWDISCQHYVIPSILLEIAKRHNENCSMLHEIVRRNSENKSAL